MVTYRLATLREHFLVYIVLWSLLAIVDVIFIVFF
ncbi:DUF2770 family protein [Enterobacter hormaechei]